MDKVSREQACVQKLEVVDEYLGAQSALREAIREGFFNVSRARYSMGSMKVGRLQYEGRHMKTTVLFSKTLQALDDEVASAGESPSPDSSTSHVSSMSTHKTGLRRRPQPRSETSAARSVDEGNDAGGSDDKEPSGEASSGGLPKGASAAAWEGAGPAKEQARGKRFIRLCAALLCYCQRQPDVCTMIALPLDDFTCQQ
ncbi:hypothetical protein CYMTET_53015 [Cymbomonas tetramitiformis]|uniref:Vacuolar ATPase assembly protein VMA22 n=1 Tax=Cymbomonas tetramitiformis TaxID=36881 RepID=A0AAE0EQ83_9CHLO|nr:hypothetical protein CYMTET_53015 [Cymbomonas tetramitiformis]